MFDQTFVDGVGKTHKSWTVALSFAAEFVAIGVMILIPLIWTEVLPRASSLSFLTAPAPPPPPPPPPPPTPPVQKIVHVIPRQFNGALTAPRTIPKQVANIVESDLPPVSLGDGVGVPGGIPGGTGTFGGTGGVTFAAPPPPPPPPPVAVVKPKDEGPRRISSGVQAANLIIHPNPVYPAIAKSARIQGTVVLQAIIGKDGTVQNLKMISAASPLLVQAAMDAVKKWVYRPTTLNGEAVDVITEITVNFTLQ